jgi:2-dehydropantoate 2-reductase
MKVGILGAGAMGSLVGYYCKKGGAETCFIDPYAEHMRVISEKGLTIEIDKKPAEVIKVDKAVTSPKEVGVCDVVILLVKGMNTKKTVQNNMALIGKDTVLITLQNGIGNVDLLKEILDEEQIGFGMLKCSATLTGPGKVFGESRNPPGADASLYFYTAKVGTRLFYRYEEIKKIWDKAGFVSHIDPKTEVLVWEKLSTNAMGNIPCALIQVAPQDFASNEYGVVLYKEIVREICNVAKAKGLPIDYDELWQRIHVPLIPAPPITRRTFTSAIHDVSRKHKTEADFINGAIYREGQKLGVPTPYNETVWRLIKVLEDNYDNLYVPENNYF